MATRTTIWQQLIHRKVPIPNSTTNAKKLVRWLVKIIPAEDAPLLASEVSYEDLPKGTIIEHAIGDGSFKDGIFFGTPETEQYSLQINYRKLPDDLREWISTASGVSVTVDDETFWVSSVWIISTDAGDATLDPEDFQVRFIGVHRHQANATYNFSRRRGTIRVDLKLDHIAKACLEAVTIDALRNYCIDEQGGFLSPHQSLFQVAYNTTGTGATYGIRQTGPRNPATGTRHQAWLLPLRILFEGLAARFNQIVQTYLRVNDDEIDPTWAKAGGGWYNDGRPLAQSWTLYKQLHDGTRAPGAELDTNGYDVMFPALISDVAAPGDMSSSSANWIGGQLGGSIISGNAVGRGDDTLYAYNNGYDLLKVIAENMGEKHLPIALHQAVTNIYSVLIEVCLPTADGYSLGVPWATVDPADFLEDFEWTPNEQDLRGCEIDVPQPGPSDRDVQTVSHFLNINQNEKPHTLRAAFHNLPIIGNAELDGAGVAALSGPQVFGVEVGFRTDGLYYEDTPSIATTTIAIRVHSGCQYNYGKGSEYPDTRMVSVEPSGAYPVVPYNGPPSTTNTIYKNLLWEPLTIMLHQDQERYNMFAALCQAVVKIFARNVSGGNPHGTAQFKGTLIGNWPASIVGRRFLLGNGTDGFTLTGTATTLWDLTPSQRSIIISSSKPNDVKGITEIEGVATDDDAFWVQP